MLNSLNIFTDGGSRGNPGPAAVGVVVKDETGKIIGKIGRKIGETTNNVAEYTAVIEALTWIKDSCKLSVMSYKFYIDSSLVVNQLNGLFKVKNPDLRNLILKIRMLEGEIGGNIAYKLIPREKNWEADVLVNLALDGRV